MSFHLDGLRSGGAFNSMEDEDEVVADINTTPLVDIMLVLLIIFLITIPVATHAVKVNLPTRLSHQTMTQPGNVAIVVKPDGSVFWNEQAVADIATLRTKLVTISGMNPQPQIQVWGDMQAKYDRVGQVIKACQDAGIRRVDFITQPPKRN